MNLKVTETATNIRGVARSALSRNWMNVFLGMVIYIFVLDFVADLLTVLFPNYISNELMTESISYPIISYLYIAVISGPLSLGMISFIMSFFRKKDINPGYMFNGFGHFFKAFGLQFVRGLLTAWPLILVYGGFLICTFAVFAGSKLGNVSGILLGLMLIFLILIIAAIVYMVIQMFSYSQALYMLCDDLSDENLENKRGIMKCLKDSKMQMNGNKAKLFTLQISYIGWFILASIPEILISSILQSADVNNVVQVIISFIATLPIGIYYAYFETGKMVFYDILVGKLVARPMDAPFNDFN